jgi:hypothetical protein
MPMEWHFVRDDKNAVGNKQTTEKTKEKEKSGGHPPVQPPKISPDNLRLRKSVFEILGIKWKMVTLKTHMNLGGETESPVR